MAFGTFALELEYWLELKGWPAGTLEMSSQLAREYRKCGLTMDLDIGFTTRGKENT